jgi:hypothetical protein
VIDGDLSVGGALRLGDFAIYADETQMISASANGVGCFHGTWSFEVAATTSDRRLKSDIVPLAKSLEDRVNESDERISTWLLRELRPVSFVLNDGDGIRRFGFVAQELERVMPELVRKILASNDPSTEQTLSVIYQDLVAVLTMIVQDQDLRLSGVHTKLVRAEERITNLEARISEQARMAEDLAIRMQELEKQLRGQGEGKPGILFT